MESRLCKVLFSLLTIYLMAVRPSNSANLGCQHVKFAFTTKGLSANDVPSVPQMGKFDG